MPFTPEQLQLLDTIEEVHIETRSGDHVYRTVIWVVVDDETVFVRSFLGESGRWYRRTLTDPEVAVAVAETSIPARAVPATDPESIERASEGFVRKYPKGRSLDAMIRSEVLDTTLRLDPVV